MSAPDAFVNFLPIDFNVLRKQINVFGQRSKCEPTCSGSSLSYQPPLLCGVTASAADGADSFCPHMAMPVRWTLLGATALSCNSLILAPATVPKAAAHATAFTSPVMLLKSKVVEAPPPPGFTWSEHVNAGSMRASRGVVVPFVGKLERKANKDWRDASAKIYQVLAAVVAVQASAAAARLRTYTPEAVGVFGDIGRGLGAVSRDYAAAMSAVMAVQASAAAARLRTYTPEAVGVFGDIGRGLGAVSRGYATAVATAASARCPDAIGAISCAVSHLRETWSVPARICQLKQEGTAAIAHRALMMRALQLASLKREGKALVTTRLHVATKLRLATLKRDGDATIARRAQIDKVLQLGRLKREGEAVIATREQMMRALKLATLKREGVAAATERAQIGKALHLATLKREGLAAISGRAQIGKALRQATLKREGVAAIAAREQMAKALTKAFKLATLKREGAAAIARREQLAKV